MKLLKEKGLLAFSLLIVTVLMGSVWYVKRVKDSNDQNVKSENEDTKKAVDQNEEEEKTEQEESKLVGFDLTDKKGDINNLGANYFITDIKFGKHIDDGYERVVIVLDSSSDKPPYFEAKETNSESNPIFDIQGKRISGLSSEIIKISLSDTRTFNIDEVKETYTGSDTIKTDGEIISEIKLVNIADDSNSLIILNLTKQSSFKVTTLTDPLRVVVDVAL